jgi:large subunit ribosomal protein L18
MDKKSSRLRRSRKTRARIKLNGKHRLCIHRTPQHIYAQVIAPDGGSTLVSSSTLDASVKAECKSSGNIEAAIVVGKAVAAKALEKGIKEIAFDRSGFKYHGRIKALADAAREQGLVF